MPLCSRGPDSFAKRASKARRRFKAGQTKGGCGTCRFLAGHSKAEERPVLCGNAGFFQTFSKKKCARFQLPSNEIAVTIAHVRRCVKGFPKRDMCRELRRAFLSRKAPKKAAAGSTPTCMDLAALYRRIRRRVPTLFTPQITKFALLSCLCPLFWQGRPPDARRTHSVSRAYGGNHGSKPQLWRVPLHKRKPYVSNQPIGRTASFRAYGVP